jgi:hypothetical protein
MNAALLEPASINAGDTVKWLVPLPQHPASEGWSVTYTLVNGTNRITFAATPDGDDHLVNVPAATSGTWAAGTYEWRAQAAKAGEIYTVRFGRIVIHPAFTAPVDARSQAVRMLEAVEAFIESRATSGPIAEYQIAGRSLRNIPIPELLTLRDRLRMDAAREQAAADLAKGLAPRGRIHVRFGQ